MDPDEVQLFFVRFGRYVHNLSIRRTPGPAERKRLRDAVRTFFDVNQLRPVRYNKPEVDEIRILLTWMYANRESTENLSWSPGLDASSFTDEILERISARQRQTLQSNNLIPTEA